MAISNITVSSKDSQAHRWYALALLVISMAGGYMMLYALSPLQGLLQTLKGWTNEDYSLYSAAEPFLNVFCGLLFIGGMFLDRFGLSRAVGWASSAMIIGSGINWYALASGSLMGYTLFGIPASVAVAASGFMLFGVGVELAGVAASRTTVRWFAGRELSLAMGIQLACSRVAVAIGVWLSPRLALWGSADVARPVACAVGAIIVGAAAWFILCRMESRLSITPHVRLDAKQKRWNLRPMLTNKLFWLVTAVIVLYYASVLPFYRFAALLLTQTAGINTDDAATVLTIMPLAGALFTPVICASVDRKGMALRWLATGSAALTIAYIVLAAVISSDMDIFVRKVLAISVMTVLAIGSAIASASVWPLVPRIISAGDLGKGYAFIYWIQNLGFMVMPLIAGQLMGSDQNHYNYTAMTAAFAATAILCMGCILWLMARNRNYGLNLNAPEVK